MNDISHIYICEQCKECYCYKNDFCDNICIRGQMRSINPLTHQAVERMTKFGLLTTNHIYGSASNRFFTSATISFDLIPVTPMSPPPLIYTNT